MCCTEHGFRGDVGMLAVAWCAVSVGIGLGVVSKYDGMSGAKTCESGLYQDPCLSDPVRSNQVVRGWDPQSTAPVNRGM